LRVIDGAIAFLASKSIPAAERLLDELYDAFELLAQRPHLGHTRADLTAHPVFFWTAVGRYAVVYRKTKPLQIVRVLDWRRDVAAVLRRGS
jgi:plasmid stabilization system protein ParE